MHHPINRTCSQRYIFLSIITKKRAFVTRFSQLFSVVFEGSVVAKKEHIPYFIDVIPDAKDKRDVFTGFVSIQGGDLPAFGYKMSDTKELVGVYLWHAPDVEISNTDIPAEFADEIRRAIRLRYLTVIVKE